MFQTNVDVGVGFLSLNWFQDAIRGENGKDLRGHAIVVEWAKGPNYRFRPGGGFVSSFYYSKTPKINFLTATFCPEFDALELFRCQNKIYQTHYTVNTHF